MQNNEKKARKHVKERKIGDARILNFKDIQEARKVWERAEAERERKQAEKEMKAIEKEQRDAEKQLKKVEKERAKIAREKERAKKTKPARRQQTVQSGFFIGKSKSPIRHGAPTSEVQKNHDAPSRQVALDCLMEPCPGNAPVARMW